MTDAFHSSILCWMYRNKQFTMFSHFVCLYIEILIVPGSHLCKSQVWGLLKGHPLLHKRWNPDLCSKTHTSKPYCLESQSEDTTNSKANSPDKNKSFMQKQLSLSAKKRLFKKNNWKLLINQSLIREYSHNNNNTIHTACRAYLLTEINKHLCFSLAC